MKRALVIIGWQTADICASGTPRPGWTVEWVGVASNYGGQTRPTPAYLELHSNPPSVNAKDGAQRSELHDGLSGQIGYLKDERDNISTSQSFSTCFCSQYVVKYSWRARPNAEDACKLEVYWNGELIGQHNPGAPSDAWQQAEWGPLDASDGSTTTLKFAEVGQADSLGTFLDAVDVAIYTP